MTKCVIACSGEKICINDSLLFTNRCSNGNLSDYCKANEKFINKELTNGKISKLNIVIPTYNSGLKLLETIKSILIQNLKIETEIIVYINNPPNKTNDKEIIPETLKLFENINNPKLTLVNETLNHGLAEVYQKSITSLLAKVHYKTDVVEEIDKLLNETMIFFIDDDIIINDSIEEAYNKAIENNIILGDITLSNIESKLELNQLILKIMKYFLKIKKDMDALTLAPRGAILKKFHHVPNLDLGLPYADQIYFAQLEGKIHQIKATTSIDEQDYPGNSHFVKNLRLYFENKMDKNEALDIFYNLQKQASDNSELNNLIWDY